MSRVPWWLLLALAVGFVFGLTIHYVIPGEIRKVIAMFFGVVIGSIAMHLDIARWDRRYHR